jgi:negative regulator of flagellin synthesis FlgM
MPIIVIYIIGFLIIIELVEVSQMKINDTQRIAAANSYRKSTEDKVAQTEGKKLKKKDEVNISPEAQQLLGASTAKQHIEELKQSYQTGTYHVEANKIAEKLLPYI